jgi:TolB-like protein/tetratricopeptide (TPR) repeat protein
MATGERPPLNPNARDAVGEQLGRPLDSWKEIASWFNRSEKTVRRWEEREGMPVHRQLHNKRGSVYAYPDELRDWWKSRQLHDATEDELPDRQPHDPEPEPAGTGTASRDDPEVHPAALSGIPETDSEAIGELRSGSQPHPSPWRTATLISVFLLVVGLLVVLFGLFGGSLRESFLRRSSPVRIHSLAVLPFENLSGNVEQEYFADGMTAELITELARISSIRVISRTSIMRYKRLRKPLAEIARELDVDAVVEGEVLHSHNQVRVTAQLIDVATDRHIWAETYDRNLRDVMALQADVAQSIAKAIGTRVMPAEPGRLTPARRVGPEAYEDYLKGRFFVEKRTAEGFHRAVDYFQQSIREDPGFAQAYAGLAKTYDLLGLYELVPPNESFPKVREAADKALELDSTLSEAYTARALASSTYERDWNAAEQDFQHALRLNSNDALVHHWYAEHLIGIGQAERAITELERARELDPLSLPINGILGRVYRDARRYQESFDQCRKTLDLDPGFAMGHWCLGVSNVALKRYAEAVTEMKRAYALGATPVDAYGLGYAYAMAGNRSDARAVIEELKRSSGKSYVPAYYIASIYAALDEKNQAFAWLQRAYDERDPQITLLLLDPFIDPLRSDPRFNALVRQVGFP